MQLKLYLLNYQNIPLDILLNNEYISLLEKSSFEKYKNEAVKKERIVSSILKNKYIGSYHLNEFGKPISEEKYFNISHSHGYIALVIDTVPVGIDIEKIRPVDNDLKDYISSPEEKEYIHDDQSFFEIWTSKESLVKANGKGIKQRPNEIPGLPLNDIRNYENKIYRSKTVKYDELIITISRENEEEISLDIIKEII